MYFPSGKLEALKSCSNLSKASLRYGLSGSIDEGPLGLSSCWPFTSSRPRTKVEDLGIVSLWTGRSRVCLKVLISSANRGLDLSHVQTEYSDQTMVGEDPHTFNSMASSMCLDIVECLEQCSGAKYQSVYLFQALKQKQRSDPDSQAFSSLNSILWCKVVPGVGGTVTGVFKDKVSKCKG